MEDLGPIFDRARERLRQSGDADTSGSDTPSAGAPSGDGGPDFDAARRKLRQQAPPDAAPEEGGGVVGIFDEFRRGIQSMLQGRRLTAAKKFAEQEPIEEPFEHVPGVSMDLSGTPFGSREEAEEAARQAAEQAARRTEKINDITRHPAVTRATEQAREGDILGMAETLVTDPTALPALTVGTLAQQSDALVTGSALAAGTGLPGAVGQSALTAGITERRAQLRQSLRESGADLTNPDEVMRRLQDPEFRQEVEERAAERGLAIGTVDAVANLATAGLANSTLSSPIRSLLSGGTQVASEGAGEAAAQATQGEVAPGEIALETAAGTGPATVETAAQLAGESGNQQAQETAKARKTIQDARERAPEDPEAAAPERPLADMDEAALRSARQNALDVSDRKTVQLIDEELQARQEEQVDQDSTPTDRGGEPGQPREDVAPQQTTESGVGDGRAGQSTSEDARTSTETARSSDTPDSAGQSSTLEKIRRARNRLKRQQEAEESLGLGNIPEDPAPEVDARQSDGAAPEGDDADAAPLRGGGRSEEGQASEVSDGDREQRSEEESGEAEETTGEQAELAPDIGRRAETRPEEQVGEAIEEARERVREAESQVQETEQQIEEAVSDADAETLRRLAEQTESDRARQQLEAELQRRGEQGALFEEGEGQPDGAEQDLFGQAAEAQPESTSGLERMTRRLEQREAGLQQAREELLQKRQREADARQEARESQQSMDLEQDEQADGDTDPSRGRQGDQQPAETDSEGGAGSTAPSQPQSGTVQAEPEVQYDPPTDGEKGGLTLTRETPDGEPETVEAPVTEEAVQAPEGASPADLKRLADEAGKQSKPLQTLSDVSSQTAQALYRLAEEGYEVRRSPGARQTESGVATEDGPAFTVEAPKLDDTAPQTQTEAGVRVGRARRGVTSRTNGRTTYRHEPGDIVAVDEDGTYIDRRAGEKYEEAIARYFAEHEQDLREGSVTPRSEAAYTDAVARGSDSPQQVVEAYRVQETRLETEARDPVVDMIEGWRYDTSSFDTYTDPGWRNEFGQLTMNWLGGSKSLDAAAQEITSATGIETTPEDIVDHLTEHPGGPGRKTKAERTLDRLADRFETLTGISLTSDFANLIASQQRESLMGEATPSDFEEPEAPFQRMEEASETATSAELVEVYLRTIAADLGAGSVNIVNDPSELEGTAAEAYNRGQRRAGEGFSQPAMFFNPPNGDPEVYVVAADVEQNARAMGVDLETFSRATLLHEVVAHKGLRGLFGEEFDAVMDELYFAIGRGRLLSARTADGIPLSDAYASELETEDGQLTPASRQLLVEEYLARLAEDMAAPETLLQKIWRTIRDGIKRTLGAEITRSELRLLLEASRDRLRANQERNPVSGTRFSRQASESVPGARWERLDTDAALDRTGSRFAENGPIKKFIEAGRQRNHIRSRSESRDGMPDDVAEQMEAAATKEASALQALTKGVPLGEVLALSWRRDGANLVENITVRVEEMAPEILGALTGPEEITLNRTALESAIRAPRERATTRVEDVLRMLLHEGRSRFNQDRGAEQIGVEFSPNAAVVRFSRKQESPNQLSLFHDPNSAQADGPGQPRNMVAVHNLDEKNVRFAVRQMDAHIPVPSVATVRYEEGFADFGDITLVGTPDLIDPEEGTPTFGGDAYTPTTPGPAYKGEIEDFLASEVGRALERWSAILETDASSEAKSHVDGGNREEFYSVLSRRPAGWLAYLEEQGRTIDPDDLPRGPFEGHMADQLQQEPLTDFLDGLEAETLNRLAEAALPDSPAADPDLHRRVTEAYREATYDKVRDVVTSDLADIQEVAAPLLDLHLREDGLLSYDALSKLEKSYQRYSDGERPIDMEGVEKQAREAVQEEAGTDQWREARSAVESFWRNRIDPFSEPRMPSDTERRYNLYNIVEKMRDRNVRAAEGGGTNFLRALTIERFGSVEEVQAQRDRLTGEEAYQQATSRLEQQIEMLWDKLKRHHQTAAVGSAPRRSTLQDAVADYVPRTASFEQAREALAKQGFEPVPSGLIRTFMELVKDLRSSPVRYFESKPQRAVALSEFKAAIVPDNTPADVREMLAEEVGRVAEYEAGSDTERQQTLAEESRRADVRFQRQRARARFKRAPAENTQQFADWFGDSVITEENGSPRVLFHETEPEAAAKIEGEGFDIGKVGARGSDPVMPDGVFMKPTDESIGIASGVISDGGDETQIPLYASIENPLRVTNRQELIEFLKERSDEYQDALLRAEEIDRETSSRVDELEEEMMNVSREQMGEFLDEMDRVLEEGREAQREEAARARELATEILKAEGYDGLIMQVDGGAFGRSVTTIVAFSPEQVRIVPEVRFQRQGTEGDARAEDDIPPNPNALTADWSPSNLIALAKKQFRQWLQQRSLLPESVWQAELERRGSLDAAMERTRYALQDFGAALQETYDTENPGESTVRRLNEALQNGYRADIEPQQGDLFTPPAAKDGVDPEYIQPDLFGPAPPIAPAGEEQTLADMTFIEDLPEPMREAVGQLRDHIDAVSRLALKSGLYKGELKAVVSENLGTYVTRQYRVHNEDGYGEMVKQAVREYAGDDLTIDPDDVPGSLEIDPQTWNRAVAHMRETFPGMSDKQVLGRLFEMLTTEDDNSGLLEDGGKLGSVGQSIYERREDIPAPLRDLMGEYKDPRENYLNSMTKMLRGVTNQRFLNRVKQNGLGKWLRRPENGPVVEDGIEYTEQIAAEGSQTMAPLNGVYTTKEIKEAFETFDNSGQQLGTLARHYMKVVSFVKANLTVFSQTLQMRNYLSAYSFGIEQGYWLDLPEYGEAWRESHSATWNRIADGETEAQREMTQKLLRLGVLDESPRAGEMREMWRDAGIFLERPQDGHENMASKYAKAIPRKSEEFYRAGDNVHKITAFIVEKARYEEAYPGRPEQEIDRIAAERVRDTFPTYSLVPESVKALRRNPFVATFPSFWAERVRNQYNTLRYIVDDLKDPRTRKIALKRAAGKIGHAMMWSGAASIGAAMAGIGDEEDEQLRRFLPSWEKYSYLVHLPSEKGTAQFVDIGYLNTNATFHEALFLALEGGENRSPMELALATGYKLAEPFVSGEILTQKIFEAVQNQTLEDGQPIANEQLPLRENAQKWIMHVAETLVPRTLKTLEEGVGAFQSSDDGYGIEGPTKLEAIANPLLGQNMRTVEMGNALKWRVIDLQSKYRDAGSIFYETLTKRGSVSRSELEEAYRQTLQAKKDLIETAHKDVVAAETFGLSHGQAYSILRSQGVSKRIAVGAMTGRFLPKPDFNALQGRIESERRAGNTEDAQILQMRQRMARQVMQQVAAEFRRPADAAATESETDRLPTEGQQRTER